MYEKINYLFFFLVIVFVVPFIMTATIDEDYYFVQFEFPSFFCLSRNTDFNFGYLLFPAIFLNSFGLFLLLFILFHMQLVRKCIYSVSAIIIMNWGVHQWYRVFGQQCSISKQCFSGQSLKLKNGGARLKGRGAPWYHPLGETLVFISQLVIES